MADAAPADEQLGTAVLAALGRVIDPEIRRPVTELDMIRGVDVQPGGAVRVDLQLTIVGCPAADTIERDVRVAAGSVDGVSSVDVDVSVMAPATRAALTERLRAGRPNGIQFTADSLTRVIAVTSGKGGVGKSTVTANLAVALARRGLRVGIVDVDVHGFSIPGLMGLTDEHGVAPRPTRVDSMILPPVAHDVKVVSIGMFVDDASTAVSWRGPMLHRTVNQFLTDVFFGDLDVLLLDLPPGTGDVAISVGQLLPHAEVLVVTTPQAAAADVAERSGIVARQTGQRVIGVIENMAGLVQPDGSVLHLFGKGGGAETAARLSRGQDAPVPVLGSVPLSVPLREGGDTGLPVVLGAPEDPAAVALAAIADGITTMGRGLAGRKLGLSLS
ncbi:ATP-binding protein involved in chromosome partitioning [Curtobacterium sp. PhB142]|uniref:Mrp/NBP35 family ATP-binding protein n=1 Tax=unclassified Curtobacterium TaxID=257496 RepID=UPI0010480F84|nr:MULTISPECIES: Mrp/NBP35 family ATP-binding protein [unclassified Curtobacterium]TCL87543.1 ATP-binding protein involved in chromosome partitioning [Curtobacterium sp. PhB142]TCM05108.1 ATP-binding protein involved in chromosome partitioning [Curtobacterium sp. PhB134]